MIDAKFIAEKIWKSKPRKNVIELQTEVLRIIREKLKVSDLQAFDICTELLPRIKRTLKEKIDDSLGKGISPRFRFSSFSDDVICVTNGFLIERREKMLREIRSVAESNWKAFEELVRNYLTLEGIKELGTIGRTKEGGVDFYGILDLSTLAEKPIIREIKLRAIGQIKHRKEKIGEGEAVKFWGHLQDLKDERGRAWRKLPSWFKKLSYSFAPFFVTDARFTSDAKKYLVNRSVTCIDGEQLAEWMARKTAY